MSDRHWEKLNEVIGYNIKEDEGFTLGKLMEKGVIEFEKEISDIAIQAAQEQALMELLQKVINMWQECDMPLSNYKELKDVFILSGLDDVIANLDESLVTINTINSSRYVQPIREHVDEWNKKLVLFQETLDEWMTMQKKWMYLENIFSGGDIAKQLPTETKLFVKIDKYWKETMQMTWDNPDAITAGTYSGRKEAMASHNNTLGKLKKAHTHTHIFLYYFLNARFCFVLAYNDIFFA